MSEMMGKSATSRARSSLKSPTRAWISSATKRCAICLARWASRASAATTRGTGPPASKPRRFAALRIWRHAQPRHHHHAQVGHRARRHRPAAQSRIRRPARAPVRVSKLVRHGRHARLFALHDPVRRRPLYAGQESRHGAFAPDPHAVSGRLAFAGALSRFRRGAAGVATARASRSGPTTPTRAKVCAWRSASWPGSART